MKKKELKTIEIQVGFIEMVKELKQFQSEWSDYIKKFTICEKDVNRANSLAQDAI